MAKISWFTIHVVRENSRAFLHLLVVLSLPEVQRGLGYPGTQPVQLVPSGQGHPRDTFTTNTHTHAHTLMDRELNKLVLGQKWWLDSPGGLPWVHEVQGVLGVQLVQHVPTYSIIHIHGHVSTYTCRLDAEAEVPK